MTQHADKVEQVRRRNRLDAWRKGVKFSLGQAIDEGADVEHLTIYNDDSQTTEYLKSDRKTEIIPSPHSQDELVDMMMGDENKTAEAMIRRAGEQLGDMMAFKIEKDVPTRKFYSQFCETLDQLEVGDSMPGLTKKEVYKYRVNFYTKNFADRKFTFRKEDKDSYRIWRIA